MTTTSSIIQKITTISIVIKNITKLDREIYYFLVMDVQSKFFFFLGKLVKIVMRYIGYKSFES